MDIEDLVAAPGLFEIEEYKALDLAKIQRNKFGGGYVLVQEKLPNYVVPELTGFQLKPYVSQCVRESKTTEAAV